MWTHVGAALVRGVRRLGSFRRDGPVRRNGSVHRSRSFLRDRRARIPFALIGVLLLVTSAAYAAGVAEQGLIGEDRTVERAVERVDADTTTALKHAARDAAHAAAAEPVTRSSIDSGPHDHGAVRTDAVRSDSPFEDALRIRLVIAATEALSVLGSDVGDVTASTSLPPVEDPTDLAAARDSVVVEPVANGTAMRVTFEGVRTHVTRDDRTVHDGRQDRTVVVAVPTLAAHERTERFEKRLGRGPVEGAGLGRQLTASLYPMTWARGYAQYAGAPVQNVLANRHVELSTNAGIVRTQRDVFGTSDPNARAGVARATAKTGVSDLLEPTGVDEASWSEAVLDTPTGAGDGGSGAVNGGLTDGTDGDITDRAGETEGFAEDSARLNETTPVEIAHAADVGAVAVSDELDAIGREAFRVAATADATAVRVEHGGRPRPRSPGPEWTRIDRTSGESLSVAGSGIPTGVPSGSVRAGSAVSFGDATRTVTVDRRATTTWEREVERMNEDGNLTVDVQRMRTRASTTDRYRVSVAVRGRYAPDGDAPSRRTATFGSGGWGDGTDLSDTPDAARADLDVASPGDVDRLSRAAVRRGGVSRSTEVTGERPSDLASRITADIETLRSTVHSFDTRVRMGDVAAGEADPHAELAADLRAQRMRLADPPSRYDGAADRARYSARIAFLDAVITELESASADESTATDSLFERVEREFGGPSIGDVIASREAARETDGYAVGEGGPGGAVTFTPDGSPGYLPRTAVDGTSVDGVEGTTTRPLATRNLNYVTVPYGELSGGIVDRLLGTEDTVGIGVAGRSLAAADDALAGDSGVEPELRADRDALAHRLEEPLHAVDRAVIDSMGDRTSLTPSERRDIVDTVGASYASRADRAIAIENGSYATRIAELAAARNSLTPTEEAALAAHVRVGVRTVAGRDAVRVPTGFVDDTTDGSREILRNRMEGAVEDGTLRIGEEAAERWAPNPVRRVGAGLPIAPVPGYWVATVNAWKVTVRGEYPSFRLHGDVGRPGEPFVYDRSPRTVSVSVDGTPVSLGSTEPIRFETETVVVVAVPAGPPGVGDVDGTRDETSPAWPCPEVSTADRHDQDGLFAAESDC